MKFTPILDPDSANQRANYVLFIEGDRDSDKSIDPTVLRGLFEKDRNYGIEVEKLGSSFYIENVAKSLFEYHSTYYFLIDRDHRKKSEVEESWENFPNEETNNLLIWNRREIENYFIDPDYLKHSKYYKKGSDLKKKIENCANERLFMDIANYVIVSIREETKKKWITKFTNVKDFPDCNASLEKLKNAPEFSKRIKDIEKIVSNNEIEKRFEECHQNMTNGKNAVEFGKGQWMDLIQGKPIFNAVINSECFVVESIEGIALQGAEKTKYIVQDLLEQDDKYQPADFIKLRNLINDIMQF